MTKRRRLALALAAVALVGAAGFALAVREPATGSHPRAQRPALLLLTSLPLIFGEQFSLESNGSGTSSALKSRYELVPISVASPDELAKGRLLLMAHPSAQTAENLVALDRWVRDGGHVLLLADPLLEWASQRPLGDPLRPAPMFADTGLLAHWGLRLDSPDERGPARRTLGGLPISTDSPGLLFGSCPISNDRLVARCRIGAGSAIVVADADFLDTRGLRKAGRQNLDALLAVLAQLES